MPFIVVSTIIVYIYFTTGFLKLGFNPNLIERRMKFGYGPVKILYFIILHKLL